MKIVKGMILMTMGAMMVLLFQKYGDEMLCMAEDMLNKSKCTCDELDN